jgi:hypothetical protein
MSSFFLTVEDLKMSLSVGAPAGAPDQVSLFDLSINLKASVFLQKFGAPVKKG